MGEPFLCVCICFISNEQKTIHLKLKAWEFVLIYNLFKHAYIKMWYIAYAICSSCTQAKCFLCGLHPRGLVRDMVYAQDIDHSHDKWLSVILNYVESAKSQTNILPAVSNRIHRSSINWIIRVYKRLWEACGLVHLTDSLLRNSGLSDITLVWFKLNRATSTEGDPSELSL